MKEDVEFPKLDHCYSIPQCDLLSTLESACNAVVREKPPLLNRMTLISLKNPPSHPLNQNSRTHTGEQEKRDGTHYLATPPPPLHTADRL